MTEVERIRDQLSRAHQGEAWHGPALRALLSDVDAQRAAAKPVPGAHSIWEIVVHVSVWEDVVRRRLEGEAVGELPPEQDWPPVQESSEAAWKATLERLDERHRQLLATLSRLPEERLGDTVPLKGYSVYVMLHGVVQHALYHAGQIALLKKASR